MNFSLKKRKHRLYRSCEDLPIYNFHRFMQTSEHGYLVVGWEYGEVKLDQEEVDRVWGGIYNEYCTLTSNNKAITYYRSVQRLMYLRTRKEIGARILIQISIRNMKPKIFIGYVDALRDWDFKYEGEKRDQNKIKDLGRQIRACDNEIGLLQDKLSRMVESGEGMPFEKELVKVEQALGRNAIDPRKTSVKKWVFLLDEIKEINQQRRKQMAKNRKR